MTMVGATHALVCPLWDARLGSANDAPIQMCFQAWGPPRKSVTVGRKPYVAHADLPFVMIRLRSSGSKRFKNKPGGMRLTFFGVDGL